jgi:hypothetical protein
MNDDERIDFTALEPRDWDAVTSRTMSRIEGVLQARSARTDDPIVLIASWRRPVLAAAAVILAVIIPAEIALEARESRVEAVRRLVSLSVEAVQRDELLSGSEILRTIAPRAPQ